MTEAWIASLIVASLHYLPMLIATAWWSTRTVRLNWLSITADALTLPCLIIVVITSLSLFYWPADRGASNNGLLFLLASVFSFGVIPLVTITSHVLTGRFLGRAGRKGWHWLKRKS